MHHGLLVDVVDGGEDTVRELLLGGDPDVAQHRAGELGEEALDEVERGAVFGVKTKSKRPSGRVSSQAASPATCGRNDCRGSPGSWWM